VQAFPHGIRGVQSLTGSELLKVVMPFPFDPSSSTLQREGKVASCELRFVPNDNEVRMLRNGSLLLSRIFDSGEEALKGAEEERQRMLGHEWSVA
jgi:hypothetical protein